MSMRSHLKKGTKKVGRAFGISDVLDKLNISNEIAQKNYDESFKTRRFDDELNVVFPFVKFYYYNEIAKNLHPAVFEKYRDCNKGKDVVIVACGPSVDKYKPIKGAKHIAINRAVFEEGIEYDYLFMHDRQMIEDFRSELKECRADKFMAFATNLQNSNKFNASSEDVLDIGAKRFLISDVSIMDIGGGQFDIIQRDITKGILFDRGGGTVFSALQFALFTGARAIYLVGCDCTSDGYFKTIDGSFKQVLLDKTEYLWHEVKAFVGQYYPDAKIVSVNPVKLAGLFEDLIQK